MVIYNMEQSIKKVDELFAPIASRLLLWLEGKPSGKFTIEISVNKGGIRARQISITENQYS